MHGAALMVDWGAIGSVAGVGLLLLAIAGGLIGYGVLRNKVATVIARQNKADERMDRLESAIERATHVGNQVDLLRQSTESQHTLLRTEASAANNLLTAKLDVVAAEVRSFMQGQASMGRARSKPEG
jgi:hypothetical protein